MIDIGYKRWQAQMHETNKMAAAYLANEAPEGLLNRFFDAESKFFVAWRDGMTKPFEKDWREDFNR